MDQLQEALGFWKDLSEKDDAFSRFTAALMVGLGMSLAEVCISYGPVASAMAQAYLKLNPSLSKEEARKVARGTSTRLVALAHHLVQLRIAIVLLCTDAGFWSSPFAYTSDASQRFVLWAAGYFVHDVWICLRDIKLDGAEMFVHGVLCCTLFLGGHAMGVWHFWALAFLSWELSTPFVHFRWMMYKAAMNGTTLYKINGMLLIVSFFACRIVWGLYVSLLFWETSALGFEGELENPVPNWFTWVARFINLFLNGLNTFWFYKMMRYAAKTFGRRPSKPKVA